ncbi:hypothetical protein LSCM1_01288 [Leishmania martiniquensis]|uniref:Guanine nucleotide-binding protein subunit beta-like protein n=1 Tax=Leishmania martiniquensis TaxID=1580590 RepID=A0A836KCB8_9TRYP|nr:hypothetical protein LSCM1_01288 [Leishmania martiniquensis]
MMECPNAVEEGEKNNSSNISYATPWVANGLSWANQPDKPFRLAISSYMKDYRNYVDIVEKNEDNEIVCRASWEHCYPPTKVIFPPRPLQSDVVVTTADYLRLWEITEGAPKAEKTAFVRGDPQHAAKAKTINSKVTMKRVFDSAKPNDFCSPVTSCDWNTEDINTVACCSIDSTVTLWDVETGAQKTKLVAHDKDVYDIAFASAHTFASCGADGSLRFFDLRNMDHCTILYETQGLSPLLRLAWNQFDPYFIATFGIDNPDAVVIDMRYPTVPASQLSQLHQLPINSLTWSPQNAQNICTVGEDGLVCVWEARAEKGRSILWCDCEVPINNVAWRRAQNEDWMAITTSNGAQLLPL